MLCHINRSKADILPFCWDIIDIVDEDDIVDYINLYPPNPLVAAAGYSINLYKPYVA